MADMTDWDGDVLSEDETDEYIIELTDIADEGHDHATKVEVIELEDKVIELTDIVKEERTDFNLDIVKEESAEVEEDFDLEDETSFDEGLELESDDQMDDLVDEPMDGPTDDLVDDSALEHDQEMVLPQDLSLTPELLEAALEKVIEKKFADKIETILIEVMEKVIEKEIAEIKE